MNTAVMTVNFEVGAGLEKTLLDEKELAFLNGDYRFFEHALATLVSIHGDHRLVHTHDSIIFEAIQTICNRHVVGSGR